MFRARHEGDFKTLHFLHPQFIQAGDYAAALLCLDPTFISTLPLHGATTMDHGPELSLHFAYFELLDRLRRGDRLDPGSMRQKIFAFRPREDDRFFVPTDSYLYKVFTSGSETLRGEEGYVVTHEELRRTLDREIPEYIHLRAKEQQNVYRRRLRFDPCMAMATRGECSGRDCKSQHIRPDQMTVSWFNARIRSVLMEIQILNLAGFRFKGIFTCVLPLTATTPDSDLIRIDNGSASFTLSCTLRHQSSGQSPHSILGIYLNRRKGSEFC